MDELREMMEEMARCKRMLTANGDDIAVVVKEQLTYLHSRLSDEMNRQLEEDLLPVLDLTTLAGRWALCMHLMGPPARAEIMNIMYAAYTAYSAATLGKFKGDDMASLLHQIRTETAVSNKPHLFIEKMLAMVMAPWEGSNAKFIESKCEAYLAEVADMTCECIDTLVIHASLSELRVAASDIISKHNAGVPATNVVEALSEVEASARIRTAIEEALADGCDSVLAEWSAHPERIHVLTPKEGSVPLLPNVMQEAAGVARIVTIFKEWPVVYDDIDKASEEA